MKTPSRLTKLSFSCFLLLLALGGKRSAASQVPWELLVPVCPDIIAAASVQCYQRKVVIRPAAPRHFHFTCYYYVRNHSTKPQQVKLQFKMRQRRGVGHPFPLQHLRLHYQGELLLPRKHCQYSDPRLHIPWVANWRIFTLQLQGNTVCQFNVEYDWQLIPGQARLKFFGEENWNEINRQDAYTQTALWCQKAPRFPALHSLWFRLSHQKYEDLTISLEKGHLPLRGYSLAEYATTTSQRIVWHLRNVTPRGDLCVDMRWGTTLAEEIALFEQLHHQRPGDLRVILYLATLYQMAARHDAQIRMLELYLASDQQKRAAQQLHPVYAYYDHLAYVALVQAWRCCGNRSQVKRVATHARQVLATKLAQLGPCHCRLYRAIKGLLPWFEHYRTSYQ